MEREQSGQLIKIENELVQYEPVTALTLFKEDGTKDLLDKIEKVIKDFEPDFSTVASRAKIKSLSAKVSKTKTFLEKEGKKLKQSLEEEIAPTLEKISAIDKERSAMKKRCDSLRDLARKPLDDWEAKEQARKDKLDKRLFDLEQMDKFQGGAMLPSDEIQARIEEAENIELDGTWEEYAQPASQTKERVLKNLKESLIIQKQYEDQQAVIKKLEDEKAEREAEIAKEKSDQAAKDKAAIGAQKAIDDAKAETVRAQAQADNAAQAERDKIAFEKLEQEKAAKEREADKSHRAKINREARDAIMKEAGIDSVAAIRVLTAIVNGKVPHTKVMY